MSWPVRFTAVAEQDLQSAADWYREEAPHVTSRFRLAVREVQASIGANPLAYPVVHRDLRRAVLHRFPYSLFFRLQEESVLVVAVAHHARHPRRWQSRR